MEAKSVVFDDREARFHAAELGLRSGVDDSLSRNGHCCLPCLAERSATQGGADCARVVPCATHPQRLMDPCLFRPAAHRLGIGGDCAALGGDRGFHVLFFTSFQNGRDTSYSLPALGLVRNCSEWLDLAPEPVRHRHAPAAGWWRDVGASEQWPRLES